MTDLVDILETAKEEGMNLNELCRFVINKNMTNIAKVLINEYSSELQEKVPDNYKMLLIVAGNEKLVLKSEFLNQEELNYALTIANAQKNKNSTIISYLINYDLLRPETHGSVDN